MQHSETIAALSAALAKAQGQIEGAKKDSANPHFRSKYADLASCWEACRDALSGNGLAVVQAPGEAAEGLVEMTTMLVHESGEWISERLTIPLAKVDAQGYGSAITYARRYALAAMVGIAPEDDDGNAATAAGNSTGAANNAPRRAAQPETPTPSAEPEGGWVAWGAAVQDELTKAKKPHDVEAIRQREDERIRAVSVVDKTIYHALGKAFNAARDRFNPEKKAA